MKNLLTIPSLSLNPSYNDNGRGVQTLKSSDIILG